MENLWQRKLGSYWQQPPPPLSASSLLDSHAQVPNADCRLYMKILQESTPLTGGVTQDHMLSNMHGLDNLGNAQLGASFLSLISGPTTHAPRDQQPLLDPNAINISNLLPPSSRTAHGFSGGSRVSVLPGVPWLHNMDLTSGAIFLPSIPSNAKANCSNNSAILQAASLDVQKSQSIAVGYSHEKDKANYFYSSINTSSSKHKKYPHITASQQLPVENDASACFRGNNTPNSFLRVACSGISGSLHLSDTGLLGVVCTCHGLYMSISKFSEHSGSCDVDPGNAVLLDNGETIAHWWKAFSSRTEIRVLKEQIGWDWPEGISVASGVTNHPISSLSNNTFLSNQVSSSRASASYEHIHSKENHSCRNIDHEEDRPTGECSNSVFKNFMNNSHENLPHAVGQHVRGLPKSLYEHSEKASRSFTPTLDNANSLPALSNPQYLKSSCNGFSDGTKNSLIVEKPRVSSSIELRLGQPPQKSATMDTKRQLASGSNLNGVHEASKVFSRDKLRQSIDSVWQGSGSTPQYADIYANPAERRGPIEFGHARGASGAYCATTNCWKDSSNINLEETNSKYKLLSFSRNLETKCQFRNIYESSSDRHVGERMHYEPDASERDKTDLPWGSSAGTIKEHGMDMSTAPSSTNGDKEVELDFNGLVGAAKSNIEVPNEFMGKSRNFNLVLGENSTAFQGKKLNHYMSTMSADKSYGYEFLNSYWKMSSLSDITHFNRDHVKPNPVVSEEMPLGLRSRNSDFVHNATLKLPQEKNYVIKKGLQYKSVEIPSAWNMMELSYRDNGTPGRGVQECEIINNHGKQSPVTFAPSSQDPTQLSDSLRMPKYSEVGDMSRLPGCWMGNTCERFCTMKGRSLNREDLIRPSTEQLYLRGSGCNFTHSKKEHFSQDLPSTHVPEQCSSTAQANYLAGQCDLDGDNFGKLVNEDRSGAATRLLHPKLNTNCIFLKETAESFDKAASSMSLNIKSAESCSFQWRDVPKKETGNCTLTRKEQETVSRSPLGCPSADVTKSISGFAPVVLPSKEYEVSNSSSRCSAPDVMQSSSEVNKKDCSATEVRNISCADSLIGDKGSRNVRSCSSDDALDSEFCPEFYRTTSKINLIKRKSFKLVPRKQSLSLIEEIRLQNSLQSKIKRSYTFHEEDSDRLQKFELTPTKKRKPTKWMMLDVSGNSSIYSRSREFSEDVGQNAHSLSDMQMQLQCDQGSPSNCADSIERSGDQRNSTISAVKWVSRGKDFKKVYHQEEKQKTNRHKSSLVDDTARASGIFRKKGLRLKDASARPTEDRELFCGSAELTEKMTSLGGCGNSPSKSSFEKQMVRPTVCGKYGIISNGNPSKSTKIIPLSEVLKTAVSLADKSNMKADNNKKLKYTSVREKKTSFGHVKQQVLGKKVLKSRANNCASHSSQSSDWDDDSDTASCSETSDSDFVPSYALQKCNNHSITDRKPEDKLKTKFKEGRKRSLHELIFKGNSSEVVNSSFMKNSSSLCQTTSRCCREVMENAVDGRAQMSETVKAVRCSEKHLPENSDMFCCVCRGSDKGEHNQLLQCNRFLLKGLRDEAKAVDNKNVSFYRRCMPHATSHVIIPNNDNECLQPGEKVNCARTEGYKGRKREGVLHHHSRETNRNGGCLVPQEQLNAWLHIHQQRPQRKERPKLSSCNVESDCRKAYTRYKQLKSWKNLVVYKSGIHALGLYTSVFISQGAMVVEYVGEIVGLRVADRRESEYHSGKKLQHKSACYFFRIDKEHIIDATRKGGIARFVNHSCQPNCVAKVISVRTEKKVVFFAERDIYPGEEITYDYHFNHEDEGEKIPCYCNSNNCRRYLN